MSKECLENQIECIESKVRQVGNSEILGVLPLTNSLYLVAKAGQEAYLLLYEGGALIGGLKYR
jgi:hypothetical protein